MKSFFKILSIGVIAMLVVASCTKEEWLLDSTEKETEIEVEVPVPGKPIYIVDKDTVYVDVPGDTVRIEVPVPGPTDTVYIQLPGTKDTIWFNPYTDIKSVTRIDSNLVDLKNGTSRSTLKLKYIFNNPKIQSIELENSAIIENQVSGDVKKNQKATDLTFTKNPMTTQSSSNYIIDGSNIMITTISDYTQSFANGVNTSVHVRNGVAVWNAPGKMQVMPHHKPVVSYLSEKVSQAPVLPTVEAGYDTHPGEFSFSVDNKNSFFSKVNNITNEINVLIAQAPAKQEIDRKLRSHYRINNGNNYETGFYDVRFYDDGSKDSTKISVNGMRAFALSTSYEKTITDNNISDLAASLIAETTIGTEVSVGNYIFKTTRKNGITTGTSHGTLESTGTWEDFRYDDGKLQTNFLVDKNVFQETSISTSQMPDAGDGLERYKTTSVISYGYVGAMNSHTSTITYKYDKWANDDDVSYTQLYGGDRIYVTTSGAVREASVHIYGYNKTGAEGGIKIVDKNGNELAKYNWHQVSKPTAKVFIAQSTLVGETYIPAYEGRTTSGFAMKSILISSSNQTVQTIFDNLLRTLGYNAVAGNTLAATTASVTKDANGGIITTGVYNKDAATKVTTKGVSTAW